jgi:outer membrane lipopolysaccharide assembly protein LptE/RlpB
MRKILMPALALLLALLSSCGENNLDRLQGKWRMDVDETLKTSKFAEDQFSQAMGRALLESMAVTLEVDAKEKQATLGLLGMGEKESFTVLADKGNELTLQFSDSKKNLSIEFRNNDAIVLHDEADKEKALVLKRER